MPDDLVPDRNDAFLALRAGLANVVMDGDRQFTADCLDRSHRITVTRGPGPDTLGLACPCGPAIVPLLCGRFGLTLTSDPVLVPAPRAGNGRADLLRPDFIPPPVEPFRILTAAELIALPRPSWLVENLLPVGAFGVLYGPRGSYKSFVAADLACCVATGLSWQGRAVERGTAAYVLAEGSGDFGKRVEAWHASRQQFDTAGVYFIPEAVNLLDPADVERLLATLAPLPTPLRFVELDTLARCLVGGDENSAQDVGRAIAAVDRIRHATGAAVLLVHHTGWATDHERGSSALGGAADTVIAAKAEGQTVTLTCDKQKDAVPFPPLTRALVSVGDSLVLSLTDRATPSSAAPLGPNARTCMTVLVRDFLEEGATDAEWKDASSAADVPRQSFYRARTALVTCGYVDRTGEGTRRAPYRYTATNAGRFFGQEPI